MTQSEFQHSILARLDASIAQLETSLGEFKESSKETSEVRRANFILLQIRREIYTVREAAQETLTQLNTFGATLEIMSKPEAGIDDVMQDVMRWFMLLSQCERGLIVFHDNDTDTITPQIHDNWTDDNVRPMERNVSDLVIKAVIESKDVITSSNMDMASKSYQKSGSWRVPLRTVLGIPILWGDDLVGVFYGDKKITSGGVSQDMHPLFKLYGAQAAIAIRNAQHVAKLSQD